MQKARRYILLALLLGCTGLMVSCNGFKGWALERMPDGSLGPKIPGVRITFTSEDGSETQIVTTNSDGFYSVRLGTRRYRVTATCPGYHDYSSDPGFFVVTGRGFQIGNIIMTKRRADVLMITTSLLEKEPDFDDWVSRYVRVLFDAEGLTAAYVELDSETCLSQYGIKVGDPRNWEEIRNVLREIRRISEASYILILGGPLVIPRPVVNACCDDDGRSLDVPGDAWYVDFDHDQIVDEGLCLSRMPDVSYGSSSVVLALRTAVALHNRGGYALDHSVVFSMHDLATPPFGVCDACTEREAFFALMSGSDYIRFAGHGSPTAIYSNDMQLLFSIDYMDRINLNDHHPVIIAYHPCSAGVLYPDSTTLSVEFIKAGAAAYVARTTTNGVPGHVGEDFPGAIEGGRRIGPALYALMRLTVLDRGDTFKASSIHICLYGDPTLSRH